MRLRDCDSCSKLTCKQIFSHIKTIYKVRFGDKCGEGEIYPSYLSNNVKYLRH